MLTDSIEKCRSLPTRLLAVLIVLAATACTDMPAGPGSGARLTTNVTGLSFGVKEAEAPPVVRTLTVTNEGNGTSDPLDITIEGTGAASFRVDSAASPCVDLEIAPRATCGVAVTFGGSASGPQSATLFIHGGDGMDRIGVTLNGILQAAN